MKFDFEMTAKEAVQRWDDGEPLWCIELGGLGPGYEQCIHVCAVEILRDALASETPLDEKAFESLATATISFHNGSLGGLSGCQAGMASQEAWLAYKHGWRGMLKTAQDQGLDDSRFIQVSKAWPQARARA